MEEFHESKLLEGQQPYDSSLTNRSFTLLYTSWQAYVPISIPAHPQPLLISFYLRIS